MPADDDAASGPPPHPRDRTWFHPTELGRTGGPGGTDAGAPIPTTAAPRRNPRTWPALLAVLAVGMAGTVGFLAVTDGSGEPGPPGATRRAAGSPTTGATGATPDLDALVAGAVPAVVAVTVPGTDDGTPVAVASGVVVTSRRVVTTFDLGGPVTAVGLVTASGRSLTATVVSTDPDTGLVLLEAAESLPPARLVADPRLRVGSPVVALRHPSVAPMVAARGSVAALNVVREGKDRFCVGLVGTDAYDPSGGSLPGGVVPGGALLDGTGRLVGVLLRHGDAVPSDVVRDVVVQVAHGGHAYHGSLRLAVVDAGAGAGARVVGKVEGTAAAAGIRPGDVVVSVSGRRTPDAATLAALVRRLRPGDPVEVVVGRDGRWIRTTVVLVEPPADQDPDGPVVA